MNDSKGIDDIPDETDLRSLGLGLGLMRGTRRPNSKRTSEQWEVLLFVAEKDCIKTITTGEFYSSSDLALWHAFRKARTMFCSTGKRTDFGARLKPVKY